VDGGQRDTVDPRLERRRLVVHGPSRCGRFRGQPGADFPARRVGLVTRRELARSGHDAALPVMRHRSQVVRPAVRSSSGLPHSVQVAM